MDRWVNRWTGAICVLCSLHTLVACSQTTNLQSKWHSCASAPCLHCNGMMDGLCTAGSCWMACALLGVAGWPLHCWELLDGLCTAGSCWMACALLDSPRTTAGGL